MLHCVVVTNDCIFFWNSAKWNEPEFIPKQTVTSHKKISASDFSSLYLSTASFVY